jgi:hypothetical protein
MRCCGNGPINVSAHGSTLLHHRTDGWFEHPSKGHGLKATISGRGAHSDSVTPDFAIARRRRAWTRFRLIGATILPTQNNDPGKPPGPLVTPDFRLIRNAS